MKKNRLFQIMLNAMPDFVAVIDTNLRYMAVNTAFCNFISKEEQEILGKTDLNLFPENISEQNKEETQSVIDSGKPFERKMEFPSAKGRTRWQMIKTPLTGTDGKIEGVLWRGRDITEMEGLENQLLQFQKTESMGPLAAGIAHELNTPMGIILGYAQLLKEDVPEDGPVFEGLDVIERQCKIGRKIIADLLRFSRQTESKLSELDINTCVEEVLSMVENIFNTDRITIKRDFGSALPSIKGDNTKLNQALLNLLNNARDAIGTDGRIIVSTRYNKANQELIIAVQDNGSGIPPEIMDRIFDPFFTTKAVGKGTGLGLSVTFGIIQELEGKIEVQSPPWHVEDEKYSEAKGTVFIIRLSVSEDSQ